MNIFFVFLFFLSLSLLSIYSQFSSPTGFHPRMRRSSRWRWRCASARTSQSRPSTPECPTWLVPESRLRTDPFESTSLARVCKNRDAKWINRRCKQVENPGKIINSLILSVGGQSCCEKLQRDGIFLSLIAFYFY